MRKPVEINGNALTTALYTPVPVALTERVTFFIIRGCVAANDEDFWNLLHKNPEDLIVYKDDLLKISDCRHGEDSRILVISVNKSDIPECAFDFYGGDLILITSDMRCQGYVFIPYLNLFYLVTQDVGSPSTNKWMETSNKFRCIAAVHHLCSQLLILKNGEDPDTLLQELRNLQKLVDAWTLPVKVEEVDWQREAKRLLDNNVVPKIKKFAVNSNYRRIRLD